MDPPDSEATAGKVNGKGLPNLLQLAVLIGSTMPATYIAGIPIAAQRLLFGGSPGWVRPPDIAPRTLTTAC